MIKFDSIESVIEDIKIGKMIIAVDDEGRENEGDFIMAGDVVSPEAINFMAKFGRGMICAPITEQRAHELNLNFMVSRNSSSHETAFTVTVDCKNAHTGISAAERSMTIATMCDANSKPDDLVRPGHIFPLIAKNGGVLVRPGHTEAAVDLSLLAGFGGTGVICEIMKDDGTMARSEELYKMAQEWNLKFMKIEDLITYRIKNELFIKLDSSVLFPTKFGEFKIHHFSSIYNNALNCVVVSKGDISQVSSPLIRIHSECFTGDIFGSQRCDCGEQLDESMRMIEKEGVGAIIYLRQEGRGIGLVNKLKAYNLQDSGHDTVTANHELGFSADLREYSLAYQVLKFFNIKNIRLMTNNPEKVHGITKYGVSIDSRIPLVISANENNSSYLSTKKEKMGHILT